MDNYYRNNTTCNICGQSFKGKGVVCDRCEYNILDPKIQKGANGQDVKILYINKQPIEIDAEIFSLVKALHVAGFKPIASCSGHGHRPGNIALKDGRELIIARNYEEARKIEKLFPKGINGELIN